MAIFAGNHPQRVHYSEAPPPLVASENLTYNQLISKRCKIIESRIWAFHWYQNRWPWMTLNGVMAIILRYFAELSSFRGHLRKSGWLAINRFSPRNVIKYTD